MNEQSPRDAFREGDICSLSACVAYVSLLGTQGRTRLMTRGEKGEAVRRSVPSQPAFNQVQEGRSGGGELRGV